MKNVFLYSPNSSNSVDKKREFKMCSWNINVPSSNKVQNGYFKYKTYGQGHKVIDLGVNWKGSISSVCAVYY